MKTFRAIEKSIHRGAVIVVQLIGASLVVDRALTPIVLHTGGRRVGSMLSIRIHVNVGDLAGNTVLANGVNERCREKRLN